MRGDNIRNYKYITLVAKRQVMHCSPYHSLEHLHTTIYFDERYLSSL